MGGHDDLNPNVGVSRRQLIKRGAIATGAAVWATPVVGSFLSPAAAQVGTPTEEQCPEGQLTTVWVKYNVDGGVWEAATQDNDGTCLSGGCAAANEWAADQMAAGATVTPDGNEGLCIQVPEGVIIQAAAAKEGNPCDTTPDAGSDLPNGVVCFRKDDAGGVSNVTLQIQLCVPADVLAQC